jgi:hypothetical protein
MVSGIMSQNVSCTVVLKKESTMDPISPHSPSKQCCFDDAGDTAPIGESMATVKIPISTNLRPSWKHVPARVIPPLVPAGTVRSTVTRTGRAARIPSSLAKVSAKWRMRQYRATIDLPVVGSQNQWEFPSTVINVRQRKHDCQKYCRLELELQPRRQIQLPWRLIA